MRYYLLKDGEFEDKTASISQVEPRGNSYLVTFVNGRTYTYRRGDKIACVEEMAVDVVPGRLYRCAGEPLRGAVEIVRLFSTDNHGFVPRVRYRTASGQVVERLGSSEVTSVPLMGASPLFDRLAKIARLDEGDYLSKQYATLAGEGCDATAASYLLEPRAVRRSESQAVTLYPFGSNLSQMEAVRGALECDLSLIEGPRGTGKTQTILNVVANLVYRGRSVLVASPNNSATRNVAEKLRAEGLGFLVAELGRKKNVERFVATQQDEKAYPLDATSWRLSRLQRVEQERALRQELEQLREVYQAQRDLAAARARLDAIRTDRDHFPPLAGTFEVRCGDEVSLERLYRLRDAVRARSATATALPLRQRLRYRLIWRVGTWRDYGARLAEFEMRLDRLIFDRELAHAEGEVRRCEGILGRLDGDALAASVRERSLCLLRGCLFERYASRLGLPRRTLEDPWKEPDALRSEYPVVTSTTNAARNQLGRGGRPFDCLIIDESSQVDLVTGFLALASARSAVVVGDARQLPCVITPQREVAVGKMASPELPDRYDYAKNSLLSWRSSVRSICRTPSGRV